jgi:hypothetical protein
MISMTEIENWNITNPFLIHDSPEELESFPFNIATGLNPER